MWIANCSCCPFPCLLEVPSTTSRAAFGPLFSPHWQFLMWKQSPIKSCWWQSCSKFTRLKKEQLKGELNNLSEGVSVSHNMLVNPIPPLMLHRYSVQNQCKAQKQAKSFVSLMKERLCLNWAEGIAVIFSQQKNNPSGAVLSISTRPITDWKGLQKSMMRCGITDSSSQTICCGEGKKSCISKTAP